MARSQSLYSFLVIADLKSAVSPQSLSSLPSCGQTCVNSMLGRAQELGCSVNDLVCLCKNINFAYGIRDCASQDCNAADALTTVAYGQSLCSSVNNSSSSTTSLPSSSSSSTATSFSSISSIFSTFSISSLSSTSSTSSTSSLSHSATTTLSSSSSGPQSLSPGAKAGIGVGVAIGFLILCLLIYIAILLRRRNGAERAATDTNNHPRMPELGPGLVPEMPVLERPGELSTENGEKMGREVKSKKSVDRASELPS